MIRQLQLVLSLNSAPTTSHLLIAHCRLGPAVVALLGVAIRLGLAFASLEYRYDITQKILKCPPKFPFASFGTKGGHSNVVLDEYEEWLSQNPIAKSDPGHLYFRPLSRNDAINALKIHPKGTFLIRPHESQNDVVFLSFVTGASDGVKHAIIRNEGTAEQASYRCGRVGPCATIDITLRSISKILPSSLRFDPDVVAGGPSSFKSNKSTSGGVGNTRDLEEEDEGGFAALSKFGAFSGDIPVVNVDSIPVARGAGELSWDPNGDMWWEVLMEEDEDDPASNISYGAAMSMMYGAESGDREVDGVQLNSVAESGRAGGESFLEAIAAVRDAESRRGSDAKLKSTDSKPDESLVKSDDAPEDDEADISEEVKKRLNQRLQLYEQKEIESHWNIPLASDMLGGLVRGITHMLSIKTVYKQITGHMDILKSAISDDKVAESSLRRLVLTRMLGKIPVELMPYSVSDKSSHCNTTPALSKQTSERLKHSASFNTNGNDSLSILEQKDDACARLTAVESLFSSLAMFVYTCERVVMSSLCPALPLDPTSFISVDISAGESLMEQILHERLGVPLRHVRLPSAVGVSGAGVVGTSHPALPPAASPNSSLGEHVVECIESGDVMDWIGKHADEATLQTIMHTKSGDVLKPEHVLKWLWDRRIVQNVVLEGTGVYTSKQHFFRYIDPWEVSIVLDQSTVLSSARLGRGWYGPVSAYSAVSMVDTVSRYMRMKNNGSDGGFVRLWESLRAEAWLVMSISTAHEQGEREAGGPAITELTSSTLGASDPYHSCLARHLYRNALFSRLCMPHRFVAVLQIDTFALKDLAPQKFMSGVANTPIEVYAVLRLVRSGGRAKSDNRKNLADTLVTPARKIEANKQLVTSQPSEYAWREQAVMRFPLPDRVLTIGPFAEGGERNMRQPPRKLQLSIYETRSFFSDTKIGELELPLSGLSDDRPFRDWLPLSSEKGAAWFVHIQMQLRFLLMTKDSYRDSTIRSSKGKSKKVKKVDSERKGSILGSRTGSPMPAKSSSGRSPLSASPLTTPDVDEKAPKVPVAAPVMYSGLSKASRTTNTSGGNDGTEVEGVKESRLDELGDFF